MAGSSRGGGKAAVSFLACRSIGARLARSSAKSAVDGGTCRAAAGIHKTCDYLQIRPRTRITAVTPLAGAPLTHLAGAQLITFAGALQLINASALHCANTTLRTTLLTLAGGSNSGVPRTMLLAGGNKQADVNLSLIHNSTDRDMWKKVSYLDLSTCND